MYINKDINYLNYLKNKRIVIFGAGEKGKKVYQSLSHLGGYEIIAFCDNDLQKQKEVFLSERVLSIEELISINADNYMIVICSDYERQIKEQLLNKNIFNFISMSQIDFGGGEEHYDEQYFSWQRDMGKFGGKISARTFQRWLKEDMVVVEFGSGGGYLLSNITVREKVGIEINDTARNVAAEMGIKSVKYISEIPDEYADIIISTHVLEHVENPLGALRELRNKLKEGGKIVFCVPNESCDTEYVKSDINNHLYTWNCLNLGNLFKAAGYFVHSVEKIQRIWPRHYYDIEKEVSPQLFEVICEIGGKAFESNSCIIVAYK